MNKSERLHNLYSQLETLGFTFAEARRLRRIEMTLHRWAELECGDGNNYASWAIERDETTGKPYMVTYPHDGKERRRPIADREKGALKRLNAIVSARNARIADSRIVPYHQGDPRGCALYLVREHDLPQVGNDRSQILSQYYTRGVAVAA